MKILIVANTAFTITNFRLNLVSSLISRGYDVCVVGAEDGYGDQLISLGAKFVNINFGGRSKNLLQLARCYISLLIVYIKFKPKFILSFTIKANLLSALLPFRRSDCRYFPNITGLGSFANSNKATSALYVMLSRFILHRSCRTFVQNTENYMFFNSINRNRDLTLLPGSGVDLNKFHRVPRILTSKKIRFSYISRVMEQKGIFIFIDAAERLLSDGEQIEIFVAGKVDPAIEIEFKTRIQNLDIIYGGELSDVRDELAVASFLVLPTFYNEGTPKILIEGAAMGTPLITTDTPGCRTLINGNGFLIKPKNVQDLYTRMKIACRVGSTEWVEMSSASRKLAETCFSEEIVIAEYLNAIDA